MRQLVLDTETTGLDPRQDHRIIEIAALELVDRRPTGRHLHYKLNPEREIDPGATEVHGMTWDDLRDKPLFRDVASELVDFARGAEWIIHNAPFDVAFLDAEFARVELPRCGEIAAKIVDTLALAREAFPGKRNNLDALCERFGVDNAGRTLHGALLDAQILLDVYLAMTGGQTALVLGETPQEQVAVEVERELAVRPVGELKIIVANPEELAAHERALAAIDKASGKKTLWRAMEAEPAALAANMN